MRDGVRRITEVTEVIGLEGEVLTLGTLFAYKYEGENPDGTLRGRFEPGQTRPHFYQRVDYFGLGSALLRTLGVKEEKGEGRAA